MSANPTTDDQIGVYINGTYAGGVESLRQLFARDVYSVRRLSASETAVRYGRRHLNGVLEVKLLR